MKPISIPLLLTLLVCACARTEDCGTWAETVKTTKQNTVPAGTYTLSYVTHQSRTASKSLFPQLTLKVAETVTIVNESGSSADEYAVAERKQIFY